MSYDGGCGDPNCELCKSDAEVARAKYEITSFACAPPRCEHDFSGPMQELEPNSGMWSKVCSKCGVSAFDLALAGGE